MATHAVQTVERGWASCESANWLHALIDVAKWGLACETIPPQLITKKLLLLALSSLLAASLWMVGGWCRRSFDPI